MTLRGPVLTLLAVAALGAAFYLVNVRTTAQSGSAARADATSAVSQQAAIPLASPSVSSPSTPRPAQGAPSALPPPPDGTADRKTTAYTGRTSGNEVTIAIVTQADQVVAYVCDGKQLESWLTGSIANDQFSLQGGDGATVTGVVEGDAAFGTVSTQSKSTQGKSTQGKQWAFAAQRAELPAGLYQGRATVNGAPARVGWIVLPDGSQVGVADVGGVRQPAPPLNLSQPGPVLLGGGELVPQLVDDADLVVGPPS